MTSNFELPRSNRLLPKLKKLSRGPWSLTSHDRQVVSQYLQDAAKDLESYQVEVNKLKATILTLEAIQTGLRQTTEKYQAFLAPIRRLPDDILLEIFGHYCQTNELRSGRLPAASTLASVCHHWRQATISAPTLWSSFSIDFGDWVDTSNGADIISDLTIFFLERSQSSALRIKIHFPYDPGDPPIDFDWATTMDIIYASSSRWRSFEMRWCPEYLAQSEAGPLQLPNLRHLTLHTFVPWGPEIGTGILDRFMECPSLGSVNLDLEGTESRLRLPWTQLEAIELQGCESRPAFSVLSRSRPQKVTLVNIDDKQRPYDGDGVVLNTVTSLSMQSDYWGPREADVTLLQHLTLPSLSSLEIDNLLNEMPQERVQGAIHLNQFITRSACSITTLRLRSVAFTDTEILCLLRLTPALKSLEIAEYKGEAPNRIVTNNFSKHLFVGQEGTDASHMTFLPVLGELKLSIHANGLDELALSDALASRWKPSSRRLRSVEIVLIAGERSPEGPLSVLQCFKDVGLRFVLSHTSKPRPHTLPR
ncbi:hypothetical protein V5O48_004993 [Marasmius crinis-equi]|uniref:F-box domain-containing protein n=1 Tax=Marasmius crinis-equi TaxID=585013 RepID=A0ABR3FNK2_9AGAR